MGLGRTVPRLLVLGGTSALLVALGVRLLDDMLGLRPRGACVYREIEFTEETQGIDESEQAELDRTVLPGISIRS